MPRLISPPPVERPAPSIRTGNPNALSVETLLETHHASRLEIAAKEGPHDAGVILDDTQRAVHNPIAERDDAAHPHALLLRGGDLVANALARDLPLELGEGEQHVEGQTAPCWSSY